MFSLSEKFKRLPDKIVSDLREPIKIAAEKIEQRASTVHRYKTKGGLLDKGYTQKQVGATARETIHDGRVSGAGAYYKAIFYGHSGRNTKKNTGNQTWKEDKALFDAKNHLEKEIQKDLVNSIKNTIRKAF